MSDEEKGTWVYLVACLGGYGVYLAFALWAVAGSALKLLVYRRGLEAQRDDPQADQDHQLDTRAAVRPRRDDAGLGWPSTSA